MDDIKVVKIYSAKDSIQAEMILEAFSNNHIVAYKKDIGAGGILTVYGGYSSCGEEIFIAGKDEEAARRILTEMGL